MSEEKPGVWEQLVSWIRGTPDDVSGTVIDTAHFDEYFGETGAYMPFDGVGGLTPYAGTLPERNVLVVHLDDEFADCGCTRDDYTHAHCAYLNVSREDFDRFPVGSHLDPSDHLAVIKD